jgi:hypothetical protein
MSTSETREIALKLALRVHMDARNGGAPEIIATAKAFDEFLSGNA